jgi:FAD synthase
MCSWRTAHTLVLVGEDFRRRGRCDLAALRAGANLQHRSDATVIVDGERVSSSAIRDALQGS